MAALSAGYKPCGKLFDRYTLAHTLLAHVLIGLVVFKSVGPHQMRMMAFTTIRRAPSRPRAVESSSRRCRRHWCSLNTKNSDVNTPRWPASFIRLEKGSISSARCRRLRELVTDEDEDRRRRGRENRDGRRLQMIGVDDDDPGSSDHRTGLRILARHVAAASRKSRASRGCRASSARCHPLPSSEGCSGRAAGEGQ